MNKQENQFTQYNYGNSQTEQEMHPQFAQPQTEQEMHPQFAQPQTEQEMHPQFAQPQTEQEMHPQFAQPQTEQEVKPQFVQPQTEQEVKPQFEQTKVEREIQPRPTKPMQKEGDTPFEQIVATVGKKEKQPKIKKVKIKKDKPEKDENKKKKSIVIISLFLVFVLLSGGVFYYFYAIVGSKPVTAERIINKISSAQKIEGRLTEAKIINKRGEETQTLKIEKASYTFSRTVDKEKNRHMYIEGSLVIVENGEEHPVAKNNVIAMTLRPNMRLEWSLLGQKGAYQPVDKEKETLEQFVTKNNSDSQKNLEELRTFLFKGYTPTIKVEGKKTTISMNKDDLEKIALKIEDNVKTDQEKFKNLMSKINPSANVDNIIESCKNGELAKFVKEKMLPNIESMKLEFVFNETSDKEIVGKMTFQVKGVQDASESIPEIDIKSETTYTL